MEQNEMHSMKVYPCGYAVHGPLIEALMQQDPGLLLIDTRYSPRSRIPGWSETTLRRRFGERYRWAGTTLGNVNYARGGPITLAAPGITGLIHCLREGHSLILLCGCRDYASCHRRLIVEMLVERFPAATIIHPETVPFPGTINIAMAHAITDVRPTKPDTEAATASASEEEDDLDESPF
jgi:hypothetical protein